MNLAMRIANHCAPALAGIKPANLISCPSASCQGIHEYMKCLNEKLNAAGIYFRLLMENEKTTLFLVYRAGKLKKHLSCPKLQHCLRKAGYDCIEDMEALLKQLELRLREETSFPHDVAYFLGYPLEDIEDFVRYEGQYFLLNGYWKVYHDPERAQKAFRQYTSCREALLKQIGQGRKIDELFGKHLHAQKVQ